MRTGTWDIKSINTSSTMWHAVTLLMHFPHTVAQPIMFMHGLNCFPFHDNKQLCAWGGGGDLELSFIQIPPFRGRPVRLEKKDCVRIHIWAYFFVAAWWETINASRDVLTSGEYEARSFSNNTKEKSWKKNDSEAVGITHWWLFKTSPTETTADIIVIATFVIGWNSTGKWRNSGQEISSAFIELQKVFGVGKQ